MTPTSAAELAWKNEGGSLQRRENKASPAPSPAPAKRDASRARPLRLAKFAITRVPMPRSLRCRSRSRRRGPVRVRRRGATGRLRDPPPDVDSRSWGNDRRRQRGRGQLEPGRSVGSGDGGLRMAAMTSRQPHGAAQRDPDAGVEPHPRRGGIERMSGPPGAPPSWPKTAPAACSEIGQRGDLDRSRSCRHPVVDCR